MLALTTDSGSSSEVSEDLLSVCSTGTNSSHMHNVTIVDYFIFFIVKELLNESCSLHPSCLLITSIYSKNIGYYM